MKRDNRAYDYIKESTSDRPEYPVIRDLIEPGSTVVDFGCGNGSLLHLLSTQRGCSGCGIDVSPTGVQAAISKGLDARVGRIDEIHQEFRDLQFDYAVCNVTLQMVMYPEVLLKEMVRVARRQIVTFPNFAFYKNRLELMFGGRMPGSMLYGYSWYSTGHIHQLSTRDFREFCSQNSLAIRNFSVTDPPKAFWKRYLTLRYPDLFATTCLFLTEKSL